MKQNPNSAPFKDAMQIAHQNATYFASSTRMYGRQILSKIIIKKKQTTKNVPKNINVKNNYD